MTVRLAVSVIIAAAVMAIPAPAEACICGDTNSLAMAYQRADLVFVGTVRSRGFQRSSRENPDGSITVFDNGLGRVVFDVSRTLKGDSAEQVTLPYSPTSCDIFFEQGKAYLVYAFVENGGVSTSKCTRTQLRAEADQAIAFIDGLLQRRPQGVISGFVVWQTNGPQAPSDRPDDSLTIIASGAAGRVEFRTKRLGPYDLVLPPGDYHVWVEREGRVVSERNPVRIIDGSEIWLRLVIEHD